MSKGGDESQKGMDSQISVPKSAQIRGFPGGHGIRLYYYTNAKHNRPEKISLSIVALDGQLESEVDIKKGCRRQPFF